MKLSLLSESLFHGGFGGNLAGTSHPKSSRPFSARNYSHFVFRSSHAKGTRAFSNRNQRKRIDRLIRKHRGPLRIKAVTVGNQSIQMVIRAPHRRALIRFVRIFTAMTARQIGGADRGIPLKTKTRFWDFRPFSRIFKTRRLHPRLQKAGLKDVQLFKILNISAGEPLRMVGPD